MEEREVRKVNTLSTNPETYRSGGHVLVGIIVSSGGDIFRDMFDELPSRVNTVDKEWYGMKAYRRQFHL